MHDIQQEELFQKKATGIATINNDNMSSSSSLKKQQQEELSHHRHHHQRRKRWRRLLPFLLGQVLALLVSSTGVLSTILAASSPPTTSSASLTKPPPFPPTSSSSGSYTGTSADPAHYHLLPVLHVQGYGFSFPLLQAMVAYLCIFFACLVVRLTRKLLLFLRARRKKQTGGCTTETSLENDHSSNTNHPSATVREERQHSPSGRVNEEGRRRRSSTSPWKKDLWKYALVALIDVEANYLVVMAYRYTDLTSVQLLDCFTVPCVMLFSWLFIFSKESEEEEEGVRSIDDDDASRVHPAASLSINSPVNVEEHEDDGAAAAAAVASDCGRRRERAKALPRRKEGTSSGDGGPCKDHLHKTTPTTRKRRKRRQSFNRHQLGGVCTALLGMAALVLLDADGQSRSSNGDQTQQKKDTELKGDLLCLAASVCYAASNVACQLLVTRRQPLAEEVEDDDDAEEEVLASGRPKGDYDDTTAVVSETSPLLPNTSGSSSSSVSVSSSSSSSTTAVIVPPPPFHTVGCACGWVNMMKNDEQVRRGTGNHHQHHRPCPKCGSPATTMKKIDDDPAREERQTHREEEEQDHHPILTYLTWVSLFGLLIATCQFFVVGEYLALTRRVREVQEEESRLLLHHHRHPQRQLRGGATTAAAVAELQNHHPSMSREESRSPQLELTPTTDTATSGGDRHSSSSSTSSSPPPPSGTQFYYYSSFSTWVKGVCLLELLYGVAMTCIYAGMPLLFTYSSATFANISLLCADLYAVAWNLALFHVVPTYWFGLVFVCIVGGVAWYDLHTTTAASEEASTSASEDGEDRAPSCSKEEEEGSH